MFPMFDSNLVQNDILFEYGGSISLQIASLSHGRYTLILIKLLLFVHQTSKDCLCMSENFENS